VSSAFSIEMFSDARTDFRDVSQAGFASPVSMRRREEPVPTM
jgi:hypothetical protein